MTDRLPLDDRTITVAASIAGQVDFGFDFPVQADGDLCVEVDRVTAPGGWSVLSFEAGDYTLVRSSGGGAVKLRIGRDIGDRVRMSGITVPSRASSVTVAGHWRSGPLDAELDRIIMILQEARRDMAATVAVSTDLADALAAADAAASRAETALAQLNSAGVADLAVTTAKVAGWAVTVPKQTHGDWAILASAATVDLGAAVDGSGRATRNIVISGTATISSFGAGAIVDHIPFVVRFTGAATLQPGAALIVPTGAAITAADGDVALVVRDATAWRVAAYTRADGTALAVKVALAPLGHISGLTLGWPSATTFSVATGVACSEDGSATTMRLTSALVKSLAAFAIGTGNGALDTGTVQANKTYHVHLVERADGLVDAVASLSPAAPLMPTTGGIWTARRRIGSILTNSLSQVVQFVQLEDEFLLCTYPIDVSTTALTNVAALFALSVPTGVQVVAIFSAYMDARLNNSVGVLISSPDQPDVAVGNPAGTPTAPFNAGNSGGSPHSVMLRVRTNTAAQIRARAGLASNLNLFMVQTYGWVDTRGK